MPGIVPVVGMGVLQLPPVLGCIGGEKCYLTPEFNGMLRRRPVPGENVVTNSSTRNSQKKTGKKKSGKSAGKSIKVGVRNKPLSVLTDEALSGYFSQLNGHRPGDLYSFVLGEVERPLFRRVLTYTNGNQSEAASILGINRGTLRKKLRAYKLTTE